MEVNVQPGVINYVNQRPQSVVILDTIDDHAQTIYVITNSEKLKDITFSLSPACQQIS